MSLRAVVQLRRFTGEEYDRLVQRGFFQPEERVELVDGEIVTMMSQGSDHAVGTSLVEAALRAAFGKGNYVRTQMPLALDAMSRPEPDVAVVRGSPRDYRDAHPVTALLVVEVADATLDYDREWKGSLYARAGIADFWIVNLVARVVEIHREPVAVPAARFGWEYRRVERLAPPASATPLAAPGASVSLADLLP